MCVQKVPNQIISLYTYIYTYSNTYREYTESYHRRKHNYPIDKIKTFCSVQAGKYKYNMREDTWIIELLNDNFLHMNNFKSIPLQPSDIVLIGLFSWFSK